MHTINYKINYGASHGTQYALLKKDIISAYSKLALTIGRLSPSGVALLGTGFLVNSNGLVATTYHVIGNDPSNLVVLMPREGGVDGYQDLSDTHCEMVNAVPVEIDPVNDLAILKTSLGFSGVIPGLKSFDDKKIGDEVYLFGYPHCIHGRRAFTFQTADVGSKVLMNNRGIKSKHAVVNIQTRPGQSGSPVVDPTTGSVLGIVVGAWIPEGAGFSLGGVNPYELHQTTHCVSSNHILEML